MWFLRDVYDSQGFNALSSLEYILHCPNTWGDLLFSILVMVRTALILLHP